MKRLLISFLLAGSAVAADLKELVVAFQPQENPARIQDNAKLLTDFLAQELGIPVKVYVPTDYAAVVEALRQGHAQVAYFSAWPAVLAHKLAGAEIILAEQRAGKTSYTSQWYARKDSGIATLQDAAGKKAAFTSPTSTSGYLFPFAKLIAKGLVPAQGDPAKYFSAVQFAGGYEQALKALVRGQVDVAAASDYAPAKFLTADEQAQLVVIAQQGPVPTHGLAVKDTVPAAWKEKVQAALLKLNEAGHRDLLKKVYGADQLAPVQHADHVAALAAALEQTGLDYALKNR
jgi:phosphonate transport system substrate-binding protein